MPDLDFLSPACARLKGNLEEEEEEGGRRPRLRVLLEMPVLLALHRKCEPQATDKQECQTQANNSRKYDRQNTVD